MAITSYKTVSGYYDSLGTPDINVAVSGQLSGGWIPHGAPVLTDVYGQVVQSMVKSDNLSTTAYTVVSGTSPMAPDTTWDTLGDPVWIDSTRYMQAYTKGDQVSGGVLPVANGGTGASNADEAWPNIRPTGSTPLSADPVNPLDAATKQWVDSSRVIPEVARSTNTKDSDVILSTDTTQVLNGKKVIYDVVSQRIYGLPTLPSNVYINAVSDGQLTYSPGNITVTLLDPYQQQNTRELWRRSLAEAGLTLVDGSFEDGATVNSKTDAVWHIAVGQCYTWDGAFPKVVAPGSTPATAGGVGAGKWLSVGDATLRGQLAAPTGFDLLGGRKKFVILATGQSNVQQEPAYAWEPPPNVFVWEWPGLNTNGVRFIPCPSTKINHTYAAAAELARLNPAWQVYVIRIASGGRPIEHWLPGGSAATLPEWNAYADCKNNTERALAILGVDKIDYFHWHQGENNIDDGSLYIAKWNNMFNRFVGETWFDTNTTVLVNGVTSQAIKGDPRYKTQNLMLKQIVTSRPWQRALIPTSEIVPPEMWLSDGLHMTAEGHELLGRTEADMLNRGIATQVTRGYIYSDEDGTVCIGGANPAAGGVLEVNRGSNLDGTSKNARTSLDVINTQTGSSDIASYRLIGANGTYSVTSYGVGALTNSVRIEWTGSSQIQTAVTARGAFTQYAGTTEILRCAAGVLRPGSTDNTMILGSASNRFSQVYAAIGSINTSDGREKTKPIPIDDKVLDAWAEVPIVIFQWLEAIRLKGEHSARWHFGVIAQQVRDAFLKHGIDGTQYGLLCYDEWEAKEAVYRHLTDEELASGKYPSPQATVLVEPAVEAGNRWGIRPDQCLFLEAALQRRNYARMAARIDALEKVN